MTSWWDEARPKIGGDTPSWLTAPLVALPQVHLTPTEQPDIWLVEVVLDGSWESIELPLRGVMSLLLEWREDPEAALKNYWRREPPGPGPRGPRAEAEPEAIFTVTKLADLDL